MINFGQGLVLLVQYGFICCINSQDLRIKNWKAMEALSASEQSVKSEIEKAVKAAKVDWLFNHKISC